MSVTRTPYQKAVKRGLQISSNERGHKKSIRQRKRDIAKGRFEIGSIVYKVMGNRAVYGERSLEHFSEDIDCQPTLVRECKRVYEFCDGRIMELEKLMEKIEEDGPLPNWHTIVRMITTDELPLEDRVIKKQEQIERAAERLEKQGLELADMLDAPEAIDDSLADSVIGTLTKAAQVVSELNHNEFEKNIIPHDREHMIRVSMLPCIVHGRSCLGSDKLADPMHIETGGGSMKGNDHTTIPGCREVHTYVHAHGWKAAQEHYGFDALEELAQTLVLIYSGLRFTVPKALNTGSLWETPPLQNSPSGQHLFQEAT